MQLDTANNTNQISNSISFIAVSYNGTTYVASNIDPSTNKGGPSPSNLPPPLRFFVPFPYDRLQSGQVPPQSFRDLILGACRRRFGAAFNDSYVNISLSRSSNGNVVVDLQLDTTNTVTQISNNISSIEVSYNGTVYAAATSDTTTTTSEISSSSSNTAVIAGAVVGGLLLVIVVALVLSKRRRGDNSDTKFIEVTEVLAAQAEFMIALLFQ